MRIAMAPRVLEMFLKSEEVLRDVIAALTQVGDLISFFECDSR
jgi:hypothetical protein